MAWDEQLAQYGLLDVGDIQIEFPDNFPAPAMQMFMDLMDAAPHLFNACFILVEAWDNHKAMNDPVWLVGMEAARAALNRVKPKD